MNNSQSAVSLRVVFMGTPHFSVGILEAMHQSGVNLVGIVTVADKPAGRGMHLQESPVKQFAIENNIPVLQPVKLKDDAFLMDLKQWNADLFVVVAFRMLPTEVWKMPRFGTFNLHASLLPDYRGAAPINWSIINGDQVTGLSTFFIDEEIDTGNIIQQIEMPIGEHETAGSMHDRMMVLGGKLVVDTIDKIANTQLQTVSQAQIPNSKKRPAPKLTKENTKINWQVPVQDIHNLIRGLNPYPGAWTHWLNTNNEVKLVKIQQCSITNIPGKSTLEICAAKHQLTIDTAPFQLEIIEFQVEGKKKMPAKEWLLGNKVSEWQIKMD